MKFLLILLMFIFSNLLYSQDKPAPETPGKKKKKPPVVVDTVKKEIRNIDSVESVTKEYYNKIFSVCDNSSCLKDKLSELGFERIDIKVYTNQTEEVYNYFSTTNGYKAIVKIITDFALKSNWYVDIIVK